MTFRRLLLPALLLAALVAGPASAQTTTVTCGGQSTTQQCDNGPSGGLVMLSPSGTAPSTYTGPTGQTGADAVMIGSFNALTTTGGSGNYLLGSYNSLNTSSPLFNTDNILAGFNNSATGPLSGLVISGNANTVNSSENNINLYGTGNNISGGNSWNGLTLLGGSNALTNSDGLVAGFVNNITNSEVATVLGNSNTLTGADGSYTAGLGNTITSPGAMTFGDSNIVNVPAVNSAGVANAPPITVGNGNTQTPNANAGIVVGNNNTNDAPAGVTLGSSNTIHAPTGMILGNGMILGPDAANTTVIANGSQTVYDRADAVYFGGRTLAGVSPGVLADDAVNMSQLNTGLSYFGAGASFNFATGQFVAPSFVLSGGTFTDVYSALQYLDSKPSGGGTPGPQGPQGPTGPQGPAGSGSNVAAGKNIAVTTDANGNQVVSTVADPSFSSVTASGTAGKTVVSASGVTITPASGNDVSLTDQGLDNGGNIVRNMGAGAVNATSTDGVNGAQLYQAENSVKNWAKAYTDSQVAGLRDQIARVGAEQAASAALAGNYRDTPNSFAAGVGFQGGHNAIAVGYRHISESRRVSWSIQGAISGGERSIGVGVGFGW